MTEFEGGVDFNDDTREGFASFGMVYSELIEILASISITIIGLKAVLNENPKLSQREVLLISMAIEEFKTLYDILSLGGEVPRREVALCMKKIYTKADLLKQMEFLRGNIIQKNIPRKEKTFITHEEPPDTSIKDIYGDEHC